jgi:hypothetical protein
MLYSDMLRESLDEVIAKTINSAVMAVKRQLSRADSREDVARAIAEQLSSSVGGRRAALVATTAAGGQALAVGHAGLLQQIGQPPPADRLVVTAAHQSRVTLAIARDGAAFTALDRAIVQGGLEPAQQWVRDVLEKSNGHERRRSFQPVDDLFERLAAEEVQAGRPASVIVVSIGDEAPPPGLVVTWLAKIRTLLRPSDYSGILSDREIAVLLCDATAEQAATVSARLKQLVESDESAGVAVRPAIGLTTCSHHLPFEASPVAEARASASAVR